MWLRSLSLILLCCASLSLQDAPRTVLCSTDEDFTVLLTSSGAVENMWNKSCDPEFIRGHCSILFNYAYVEVVGSNGTVDFERTIPGGNQSETLTLKQFQCQKELPVPDGSWSDKLKTLGPCLPKESWLNEAKKECGELPSTYFFGAHCSDNTTNYSEMTFVCNNPLEQSPINKMLEPLLKNDPNKTIQIESMETFATVAAQLFTTNKSNTEVIMKLSNQLRQLMETTSLRLNEREEAPYTKPEQTPVHSRQLTLNRGKRMLGWMLQNSGRPLMLYSLSTFLLMNRTQYGYPYDATAAKQRIESHRPVLRYFDAENFLKLDIVTSSYAPFGEIEEELRQYYIQMLQNDTFGIAPYYLDFLTKPNAHVKLIEMYEEIFSLGRIDRKYLNEPIEEQRMFNIDYYYKYISEFLDFEMLLYVCLAIAIVGLVTVVSLAIRNTRKRQNYSVYNKMGKAARSYKTGSDLKV